MGVIRDSVRGLLIVSGKPWTNESVLAMAGQSDPIQAITAKARDFAMKAMEAGWTGPPYDPFALAEHFNISVVARQDIPDARTVPSRDGYLIEFNPNRPKSRIKYSICHELAHTLFPDCSERVRNRITHQDMKGDEWQLETLCNIGAAELLMPIGSTPSLEHERLTIEAVLDARMKHEVSSEAVLLRAIRLTSDQCCAFSASRHGTGDRDAVYVLDYVVPSRSFGNRITVGTQLPNKTIASGCTAIGFTAKGHEDWDDIGSVRVECVGVPPYPNQTYPRVLGIVRPQKMLNVHLAEITYLRGDATRPRGTGPRIVAQIVNDRAFTWGGGFSIAVRMRLPGAQKAFKEWAENDPKNLRLGNTHIAETDEGVTVASMIAQHGFGPSPRPRIRYSALEKTLDYLSKIALERNATVHMPRIGSGQAGGSWSLIRELVEETLCRRNVQVYVYDLPGHSRFEQPQKTLEFS
jgi:uncharacterized protein DUF955